jgi:hypothetical protein
MLKKGSLKESVQTDYWGRISILGFYRRIFPASHDGGVQSCLFNSLYFRRYC